MRPIPKLIFVEDKNERKAGRIEELLAKVKAQEPADEESFGEAKDLKKE
jgi:hypothetical protein